MALTAQHVLLRPRNALFSIPLKKPVLKGKRKRKGLGGTRVVAELSLHDVQTQLGLRGDQCGTQPTMLSLPSPEEPSSAAENFL